jgi:hypothetical protein
VLRTLPTLPQIRAQVISQLMFALEQPETELRLEVLKVLTHFAQRDELKLFQKLHQWGLKTLEEGDPPTSLQATCVILKNLASSLSSS